VRFLSVCSGIEAASVAWEPLGWEPAAFAEIDPFACAVLAHRYPHVPNLGDFTQIGANDVGAVDLLIGGTPCQDFSVAGLRAGLAGDRGALTIEFLHLARRVRPEWLVWENVPGVLSADRGRAFGTFLRLLGELGYGFAYRVLDAQHFGVPQRRRRVFVVGRFGDWRSAAAVLFERESLSGHSAPRRETQANAALIAGDGLGDGVTQSLTNGLASGGPDLAHAQAGWLVADTVRSHHTAEETRGIAFPTHIGSDARGNGVSVNVAGTITPGDGVGRQAFVAFADVADPIAANQAKTYTREGSHNFRLSNVAIAYRTSGSGQVDEQGDRAAALVTSTDSNYQFVRASSAVRRLTPRECERLQGFPDDWTLVPYRKKLAVDGPRYRALGNSMAVPVVRWIGERIARVNDSAGPP